MQIGGAPLCSSTTWSHDHVDFFIVVSGFVVVLGGLVTIGVVGVSFGDVGVGFGVDEVVSGACDCWIDVVDVLATLVLLVIGPSQLPIASKRILKHFSCPGTGFLK